MPTKRVHDVGDSYHRGNTLLFDSQLTEASYLKKKKKKKFSTDPLMAIKLHNISSYGWHSSKWTKQLTYESEYSGDGHIRNGCLLISGLHHPSVH